MRARFASLLALVLAATLAGSAGAYPRPGRTEAVSRFEDGTVAGGSADYPDVNADGRFVSFMTDAPLDPGDENGFTDIYLLDRQTGTSERISVGEDGIEPSSFTSLSQVSSTGRFVIFWSPDPLTTGDANPYSDVYLRDLQTGEIEIVSVSSSEGASHNIAAPGAVTPDGRYVVFDSFSSMLVGADNNGRNDVFLRDRELGTTERVSVSDDETERGGDSTAGDISEDGRYVAFTSLTYTLAEDDDQYSPTNDSMDVFVRDRELGRTLRASVALGGARGNGFSNDPQISRDGRYVAFQSTATNLVPADGNRASDAFVRDLVSGTTERVSVASAGEEGSAGSGSPSISDDGRYVAFTSTASNLVPGDTNGRADVFVRDRLLGTTELVSLGMGGGPASLASSQAAISGDGRFLAFTNYGGDLVPGDANDERDVFLRDRGPSTGIGGLEAAPSGSGVEVSGWATFSGAMVSLGSDPAGDAGAQARDAGAELTGASLAHRAEHGELRAAFDLAHLPGVSGPEAFGAAIVCALGTCTQSVAGSPILHVLSFQAGGSRYEVRVARAGSGVPPSAPAAALFRCAASCTEVARLAASYGTTGRRVEAVLPLSALGPASGPVTAIEARSGLGEVATGISHQLDSASLPAGSVLEPRVDLRLWRGTELVIEETGALAGGAFSASLGDVPPGAYRLEGTACLGEACGSRSAPVELG